MKHKKKLEKLERRKRGFETLLKSSRVKNQSAYKRPGSINK